MLDAQFHTKIIHPAEIYVASDRPCGKDLIISIANTTPGREEDFFASSRSHTRRHGNKMKSARAVTRVDNESQSASGLGLPQKWRPKTRRNKVVGARLHPCQVYIYKCESEKRLFGFHFGISRLSVCNHPMLFEICYYRVAFQCAHQLKRTGAACPEREINFMVNSKREKVTGEKIV